MNKKALLKSWLNGNLRVIISDPIHNCLEVYEIKKGISQGELLKQYDRNPKMFVIKNQLTIIPGL